MRGVEAWCVARTVEGKRKRVYFDTKKEALKEQERLEDQINKTGKVWLELPAADKDRLIQAYNLARASGVDLVAALSKAEPKREKQMTTLAKTIDECIEAKKKAGRRDDYATGLENILLQFARGQEEKPIDRVTFEDVKAFVDSKTLESRSTIRARLTTLFKYAIRHQYRLDNPCERLEPITLDPTPVRIFSEEELTKCLTFLTTPQKASKHSPDVDYRYGLAWFILSTGAGLRPEEAEQIRPDQINFKEGWVRVEISKIRQRRVVYPMPSVMAALKKAIEHGGLPIASRRRKRLRNRLREHLGWSEWHKDVTRHTAASHWLASSEDAPKVAAQLGNSVEVLLRRYKALVTKKEAKRFWQVWAGLKA